MRSEEKQGGTVRRRYNGTTKYGGHGNHGCTSVRYELVEEGKK